MLYSIWQIGAVILAIVIFARLSYLGLAVIGFASHNQWTTEAMLRLVSLKHDGFAIFGKYHWVPTTILMLLLFTAMVILWPITLVFILSR
ncbi:hypothetical protein Asfd1_35 [Aeromonas phage Asfd_1]|nr:hypothetical protein Asfd1_35 [Aeromonas phage Asfd_1]